MKQLTVFTKKELFESAATFKLYILIAVFLVLGMMSPLLTKLLPDIISSMEDTGIVIELPEQSAIDAWIQFFKNVSQMGMLILIIVFSGIMSGEFSKGTLINLLTKGLKRKTVILSKMLAATILWTVSYLVCLAVCYVYTAYFWGTGGLNHTLLAFIAPWLFGEFLIAVLIFGGTLFSNMYGSLLSCFAVVVVLNVISIIPNVAKYNPVSLAGGTVALFAGTSEPSDFIPAVIICAVLIIALVVASIAIFNKKKV